MKGTPGPWLMLSVNIERLGRVRQELAHPGSTRAVAGEGIRRGDERDRALVARHAREPLAAADAVGKLLPVLLLEQRLVVEEVELRRAARLEEVDHPLRPGRQVEAVEHAAVCAIRE